MKKIDCKVLGKSISHIRLKSNYQNTINFTHGNKFETLCLFSNYYFNSLTRFANPVKGARDNQPLWNGEWRLETVQSKTNGETGQTANCIPIVN